MLSCKAAWVSNLILSTVILTWVRHCGLIFGCADVDCICQSGTKLCAGIHLLGDRCDCHRFFYSDWWPQLWGRNFCFPWKRFLATDINNKRVSTLLWKRTAMWHVNASLARWMQVKWKNIKELFLHSQNCTLKTSVTCSLEWQILSVINNPDRFSGIVH